MIQLTVAQDNRGIPVYGLPITDAGNSAALVADTDTSLAVPATTRFAIIAGDDHYFVGLAAVTLPAAAFSAQNAEQDKQVVYFDGGADGTEVLHFRARNATDISVSFYR